MPNTAPSLAIVLGLILKNNHIWIQKRQSHQELAGYWELPGGKIETGETPSQALKREMAEEIGVHINQARQLLEHRHQRHYFYLFLITTYQGDLQPQEGQVGRWVALDDLTNYTFPPANQPLFQKLLPQLKVLHS